MTRYCIFIVFLIGLSACTKDFSYETTDRDENLKRLMSSASPSGSYDFYKLPDDKDLDNIPQDIKNPLTPAKTHLGKLLFYETAFATDANYSSGMGTYSCATCHIPEAGFRAGAPQGVADGGQGFGLNGESRIKHQEYGENEIDAQGARPLSLINVAFVTNTFWNGQFGPSGVNQGTEDVWSLREDTNNNFLGFEAIETQNFIGIKTHRIQVNKNLTDKYGYTALFDEAFPDLETDERYSQFSASLALSAFIRSITSSKAPFQKFIDGEDDAMTSKEKEGAILFFGKARCANCHYEKNLGSMEFHAIGVKDLYQRPSFATDASDRRNLGRAGFTLVDDDIFKFRVPQLYNLADSPFYFHGSSKISLREVIDYKMQATAENPNIDDSQLSDKFKPVNLSSEEEESLLEFITKSLRDPDLLRYKPDNVLSGFCFPNNDYQSKIDLGCN